MKSTLLNSIGALGLSLGLVCTLNLNARAQGTAFTYQGRLDSGGLPYSGLADFQFSLWDAANAGSQVGSTLTISSVAVTNGLFSVTLDFGNQFPGAERWLEIAVRPSGGGAFTTLAPRQKLTATPYAVTAGNVTGTIPSGALGNAWQIGGNAGTTAGTHFVGTSDNQPLELKVNGLRALRLEPNASGAPNVIGGAPLNYVAAGVVGATIGGGGAANSSGPSYSNVVLASFGTVSGGGQNTASGNSATVGGGAYNTASTNAATVGGGAYNTASAPAANVGGGGYNTASGDSATVGGGAYNTASAPAANVGGGAYNTASGDSATVGGGQQNTASDYYATVAGGFGNSAEGTAATVAGGYTNAASGHWSTVGGGYQNTASGDYGTVGGGYINTASAQNATVGGGEGNEAAGDRATVAGGKYNYVGGTASAVSGGEGNVANGSWAAVGGGFQNTANGEFATVGGGWANAASYQATVGGGYLNKATGNKATVGGGYKNMATNYAATVAGGSQNLAHGDRATVGGGELNTASGVVSTVGGGYQNTASGQDATVPGGAFNSAAGNASFAAGRRAKANHQGAFVWADSTEADFASSGNNQFLIRAAGGVGIGTNAPRAPLHVRGGGSGDMPQGWFDQPNTADYVRLRLTRLGDYSKRWDLYANDTDFGIWSGNYNQQMLLLNNSGLYVRGTFVSSSDRAGKRDFESVDVGEVLRKVVGLPLSYWRYRGQEGGGRHLGPTAQDFRAAFGLGDSETGIAMVDADGVALAAIQGLNQKVESVNKEATSRIEAAAARIQKLESENAALREGISAARAENAALRWELLELKELIRSLATQLNGGAQ